MIEKFPKLMKYMNLCVQEAQKYSKQDKLKEIYPETYCNQTDKREKDREDLETSKREVTSHIKSILVRLTADF